MMAAAMTGATLGIHASPFSGTAGGPPKTGQFFLAIDPGATSGGDFAARMRDLVAAIHDQDGAHLPGDGRRSKRVKSADEGVAVNVATLAKIEALLG
jgi:(2R)-3-sulfolactate dehydrogenase (NADP+)